MNSWRRTITFWVAVAVAVPTLTCGFTCSPEVKVLGRNGGITPTPSSTNSGTNSFTLSFALRSTSTAASLQAQGGTSSSAALAGACGLTGANCLCDFFTDSAGAGQVTNTDTTVYNAVGNFITCTNPSGAPAGFTHMRIRDRSNLRFSNIVAITTQDTSPLTLLQILGDLPVNETRKISEYRCYINYLRKSGTTATSFSCAPDGTLTMVQVPYHFYLFADNLSNNFGSRIPDLLHNDGTRTPRGALTKFIDCTTASDGATNPNEVTLKFGLYARNTGQFTVPVQLTNAPGRLQGFSTTYGFAAKFDTATSTCPPGFVKRQIFKRAPTTAVSDSNLSTTLEDSRIVDPALALSTFQMLVDEFTGGSCTTNICTAPNTNRDTATPTNLQSYDYTAQTGSADTFCVLDSSLLTGI